MKDVKNTIFLLEKQYNSFIDQERDWNFFVGLADYVDFLRESPDIDEKFDKINKEREKEYEIIDGYEQEAIKELDEIKIKILKIVKSNKVNFKELPEALLYLQNCEKGITNPTHYKSARLEDGFKHLFKSLIKNGYRDLLKDYLSEDTISGNPEDKYFIESLDYKLDFSNFSKAFNLRQSKCVDFGNKKSTTLWGALDKLYALRRVVFNDNDSNTIDAKKFKELSEELKLIKKDGDNNHFEYVSIYPQDQKGEKFSSSNHSEIKELKKNNYKLYATRIHNYLLKRISEKEEVVLDDLNANYKNGILFFQNKELDFSDKPNQRDLLATLFKDVKKNWFYDEIQEDWDEIGIDKAKYPKDYWRKFYSAGDDINKAVAIKTQVEDFIIKNATQKGRIRVNPKYI